MPINTSVQIMTVNQDSVVRSNGVHCVPEKVLLKSASCLKSLHVSHHSLRRDLLSKDGVNPTEYVYMKDWSRLHGESLADYATRLFTSNVNAHVPHIDNCNCLLRCIIQFVTLRIAHTKNRPLTMKHLVKMESFLEVMMLYVPQNTLQDNFLEMVGLRSTCHAQDDGAGRWKYPQMKKKDIKFHVTRFIESVDAMMMCDDDYFTDDQLLEETVMNGFMIGVMECPSVFALSPYSVSNLVMLLHTLACTVIVVYVLPIEVRRHVNRLVMDFRSQCRFWHSPMKIANELLRPLVRNFLSWLHCNVKSLQQTSDNEGVLYCTNYTLRSMLKCQVYESLQQFLTIFNSIQDGLTDIKLPPTFTYILQQYDKGPGGPEKANHFVNTQILKDLNQECIILNGIRCSVNETMNTLKDLIVTMQTEESFDREADEEMSYLAKCTWNVLHAASRTVCSGDGFLIVSDLFGGEGISILAPSNSFSAPLCIETEGLIFKVIYFYFYIMIAPITMSSSTHLLLALRLLLTELLVDLNCSVVPCV